MYSRAITGYDGSRQLATYGPSSSFVWDAGAVLEIYNGTHMLVRADLGDLVGYRDRPAHSFNVLLGLGWRFF